MDYELLEMTRVEELRKLLENAWLKSDRDKKSICCQRKWSSIFKSSGRNRILFLKSMIFQYLTHLRYLMGG